MKDKIIKIAIKISCMSVIAIISYLIVTSYTNGKKQYLNSIDYQVVVNKNGSMNVTETWNININKTNTLFKTFKLDSSKYSNITNVKVKEITNKQNKDLTKINESMYHVTKDCYYGLKTNPGIFEIAWGVGLDNTFGHRVYQVSYVVEDVVTDYQDCQEIYWQFLAKGENAIPAKKVTGTITLPQDVPNLDNLRVWGHGQLNGEINKKNNHQVKFNMKNLSVGSMLEIRTVIQDKMFNVNSNKIRDYKGMPSILREESKWSNEANEKGNKYNKIRNGFLIVYFVIIIIVALKIINILKLKKEKRIIAKRVDYYRDIPREDTVTPAEAAYIYKFDKKRLSTESVQEDAVSATILDLCLKKKISLRVDEKEKVYVQIISEPDGLNKDELVIYNLLKKVGEKEEFKISELTKYAYKRYNSYSNTINKLVNYARNNLYNIGLIDKAKENSYRKCENAISKISILKNVYEWLVINHLIMMIPIFRIKLIAMFGIGFQSTIGNILVILFPLVCELLYYFNLQCKVKGNITVLTQKGKDEKAQWNGLVNYMKNFSKLKERKVLDLVLWEKYLVYATALGIADKVVEQLQASYPEVFVKEYWEDENISEKYPVIDFSMNPTYVSTSTWSPISTMGGNVSNAYHTSQIEIESHSSSSSSGSGRTEADSLAAVAVGGGRRPEWEADKMKTYRPFKHSEKKC